MMQKFSEKDWNDLIDTFSKPKMKEILYSESRDRIIKMMTKVTLTNPGLVKYAKYFPLEEVLNFKFQYI